MKTAVSNDPNNHSVDTAAIVLQAPGTSPTQADEIDLQQLLTVIRRRWLPVAVTSISLLTAFMAYSFHQEAVYEGQFQVLVEPVNADNDITADLSEILGPDVSGQSGLDYPTQVQVLRSPELVEEALVELQPAYPEIDYETLLEALVIERVNDTKIIEVRYRSENPVQIQTVLDILSEVYLRYSLDERQTNLRQGIQFIEEQLPQMQSRVNELQTQLEQFRRTYNFIDPQIQAEQLSTEIGLLSEQRLQIDQLLAQASSYLDQIQNDTGATAALQDALVYQNLVQELRNVEAEIAAELTRFQPGSLRIRVLEEQRNNLIPLIEDEAQRVLTAKRAEATNQINVLASQSDTLAVAESDLETTQQLLPTLAREYSDLQRELGIAVEGLNRFLTTRETLQIEAAQTEIPWQLIEAPTLPADPVSPSLLRNLVLGTAGSLVVAVGIALLIDKLDTRFRTVDDLKEATKLPILGTLPHQPALENAAGPSVERSHWGRLVHFLRQPFTPLEPSIPSEVSGDYGSFQFLEALRVLQTNLQLMSTDQSLRSLIVSSSLPGDGKSTLAQHLAQTAATMGKRVLLIDCDLRKPKLHKRLNLPNEIGMSDLISGNADTTDVMHQAMPFVEFYAIPAGRIPPDPTRLLASGRMRELVKTFEQSFDLVIYDTPPLLGLADTTVLASHTDGLILVARLNKTERAVLGQAIDNLRFAKVPVLGLVANDVPMRSGDRYRYYSYGYESTAQTAQALAADSPPPSLSSYNGHSSKID
ncbi:MAG: polysaccharide biosynthesis tyrosine autokinase [Cyanobacteria bacterium J06626_23]